jgi:hypothetical protein
MQDRRVVSYRGSLQDQRPAAFNLASKSARIAALCLATSAIRSRSSCSLSATVTMPASTSGGIASAGPGPQGVVHVAAQHPISEVCGRRSDTRSTAVAKIAGSSIAANQMNGSCARQKFWRDAIRSLDQSTPAATARGRFILGLSKLKPGALRLRGSPDGEQKRGAGTWTDSPGT